ncbi:MAG TPA: hypothetical protein VKR22_12005, partial [Acidimicrobiales bacterium]|nr:hypothetical protein [Acidimicrobiales bacterium]
VEPGRLDRIMLFGTPTTYADGTTATVVPDGPQGHVAIQGAGTAPLPTHFHGVDQFQVFVTGDGTVGRHRVRAGTAHYADRLTVYGPLEPGAAGMAYLTLRAAHDPGASFMPGARDALADGLANSPRPASARRNIAVDLLAVPAVPSPSDDTSPLAPGGFSSLVADDDGLSVAVARTPAGGEVDLPETRAPGAYLLVVEGAVQRGAIGHVEPGDPEPGELPAGSLAWLAPGTSGSVVGSRHGCTLAVLQFPAFDAARN